MRILYIGTPQIHDLWNSGKNPSHWLYGACEMENDGHQLIWAHEKKFFLNDFFLLLRHRPEIIFIPNLNFRSHLLLLLLASFGLMQIPIYCYLHRTPKGNSLTKKFIYRMLLSGVRHVFFLSKLTMNESIDVGPQPISMARTASGSTICMFMTYSVEFSASH